MALWLTQIMTCVIIYVQEVERTYNVRRFIQMIITIKRCETTKNCFRKNTLYLQSITFHKIIDVFILGT